MRNNICVRQSYLTFHNSALVLLIVLAGVSQLGPTQMALRYNWLMKTVDTTPVTIGGLYCAPFVHFKQYPKTIMTMNFDIKQRDLLDGRTSDGFLLSCVTLDNF